MRLTKTIIAAALFACALAAPAWAADYKQTEVLLETDRTVTGETITYPGGGAAKILAQVVVVQPGEATIWHKHGVPLYAYILAGELQVDYGPHGVRTYRPGDSFMEAMNDWHQGRNAGQDTVRILAVYMGGNNQAVVIKKPE